MPYNRRCTVPCALNAQRICLVALPQHLYSTLHNVCFWAVCCVCTKGIERAWFAGMAVRGLCSLKVDGTTVSHNISDTSITSIITFVLSGTYISYLWTSIRCTYEKKGVPKVAVTFESLMSEVFENRGRNHQFVGSMDCTLIHPCWNFSFQGMNHLKGDSTNPKPTKIVS